MMTTNKFKKYIVLTPEVFEKIKNSSFAETHLDSVERQMLNVLKNNRLTTGQRLRFFHRLLLQHSGMKQQRTNSPDNTARLRKRSVIRHEMPTQTEFLLGRDMATDPIPIEKHEVPTQTRYITKKEHGTEPDPAMNYGVDASSMVTPPPPRRRTHPYLSPTHEETYHGVPSPAKRTPKSIYADDEDDQIDIIHEQRLLEDSIRRKSMGPVDMRDLSFQNLEDPEKTFVEVENPKTGERFSVDKTKEMLNFQRKVSRKATTKNRELANLKTLNLSPKSTTKESRSKVKRRLELPPDYESFEDMQTD